MTKLLLIALLGLMACASPANQEVTSSAEGQFVKILISNPGEIDALVAKGVDVLVATDKYAIVRTDPNSINAFSAAGITTYAVSEADFVQRLANISISAKEDVQKIADLGVDIWEVQNSMVVAQLYDKHIRELREMGFNVEVVAENAQNVVKK